MEKETITDFLNDRILEIDSSLSVYLADIAAVASRGTGADYLLGLQTNLEYIENGLVRKGMYQDILAGIKAGYITT